MLEWYCGLDPLDMLVRKRDVQCSDVCKQMFDLTPADDGEDEGLLLHHVCNRNFFGREKMVRKPVSLRILHVIPA